MKQSLLAALILILFGFSFSGCKDDDDQEPTGKDKNRQNVGYSANDILSGSEYTTMEIEIIWEEGHALSTDVLSDFQNFILQYAHKPAGVNITTRSVSASGNNAFTTQDFRSFEDANRTVYNEGQTLGLFIYVVGGNYEEEDVIGQAYRNTSFALMSGRIKELTGGVGQPDEDLVKQTIMRHEMGHLLGLVNQGTEMVNDHQDEANGSHCDNDECLMYFAIASDGFMQNVIGMSQPPALDANCKSDLSANGGK
jgi:hypothetical protein